jgi:hypothetical protein
MLKFKNKYLKFKKLETFNVFILEHIKIQNIRNLFLKSPE